MRALTLYQPWATLVAIGAKNYETRSWKTEYRGPLAIHAAKRKPELPADVLAAKTMMDELAAADIVWAFLPRGAFVATCRLIDCFPVEELWPQLADLGEEQHFGDYSEGRFAWLLTDIRLMDPPTPFSGKQGLWHVPRDIETDLKKLSYP